MDHLTLLGKVSNEVLTAMQSKGRGITAYGIAKRLDISRYKAQCLLSELEHNGVIDHTNVVHRWNTDAAKTVVKRVYTSNNDTRLFLAALGYAYQEALFN